MNEGNVSKYTPERMDKIAELAEDYIGAHFTMNESGCRGESEDHFCRARYACVDALDKLCEAVAPRESVVTEETVTKAWSVYYGKRNGRAGCSQYEAMRAALLAVMGNKS